MLAIVLLSSFTQQDTPKKVLIQSVENKIEIGQLTNNRNLTFGVKNIITENLQEMDFDVTDSIKDADYIIKIELLYFDVINTDAGISVFHKDESETILRIKGYLYDKNGKKIRESISSGKSSEISISTLIISENGGINQTSVSNVIKKSSETLIINLFKK
jgi:hypothetical protein